MKKKRVRIITWLCAICLMMGCTDYQTQQDHSQEEGKPVTLDWYINYSWYTTTWGDNEVSKAITEQTGVFIDFVAPKGNESEKLDAMIASDTLPDLVTLGWWEEQCQEMIDQGKVYALNELADQYAPEFYEAADEDAIKWYTRTDGNIYGYPNSFYSPEDMEQHENTASNQNFMVRKDIYEAIGSPDMTTPEGFMEAVRKAAAMFPTVDGEPLIPIGADEFTDEGNNSFDLYLQNFLAVPYEKDGRYYERCMDSEYLSWLKVFRQLGEEGYLKDDIFIDKRIQLEQKLSKGRYFCLFYQNIDIAAQQTELSQTHPERIYIAVDGPRNSKGDDPVLPVTGVHGWTVTFISKNCQNPEKAIRFLSYLMSEEGQKMIYLGTEGSMYHMADGKPVVETEVLELLNNNRIEYNKKYGADDTYWMLQDNAMQLAWEYNTDSAVSKMRKWTYPYVAYTAQYDLAFEENLEAQQLYSSLKKIWGTTLPKLLLAESEAEFNKITKQYQKEIDQARYDRFCELATEQFQRNKEKFGMDE